MDGAGCHGCGIALGSVAVAVAVAGPSSHATLAQVERTPADEACGGRVVAVVASPGSPGAGWEGPSAAEEEEAGVGMAAAPLTGCLGG